MIAFLSDGVPPAAVYFVKPFWIAAIAASLMNCGVSKSGSPAPMAMTSRPSALSFAALAETARVGDGLIALRRSAMSIGMERFSGRGGNEDRIPFYPPPTQLAPGPQGL